MAAQMGEIAPEDDGRAEGADNSPEEDALVLYQ
jgi:hypothetical protein